MYKKKLLPVSQLTGLPKYWLKISFFKAIFSKTAFRVKAEVANGHGNWESVVMERFRGTSWLTYVGVSKNRGTPKWMVYNGKPY